MARQLKSLIVSVIALLFWQTPVFAENRHEHLPSLPLATDFYGEVAQIFGLKNQSQKLDKLFRNLVDLKELVGHAFNLSEQRVEQIITPETFRHMTLFDLCSSLGPDARVNLLNLLHIHDREIKNKRMARDIYVAIEDLRRNLLLKLPTQSVGQIFKSYFANDPLANRDVMHVSVPVSLYEDNQIEKIKTIQKLASEYQSELVLYLSVGRERMTTFEERLKGLQDLISNKAVAGIDITGSIEEVSLKTEGSDYRVGLRKVFDFASQNALQLRIHAFEGSNTGDFYEALEEVIRTHQKPLEVHIGHTNMITEHWIGVFKSNRNLKVDVDCNLTSNMFLQEGASKSHMSAVIHKIERAGIQIHIGADGRGILEHSSYLEQYSLWQSFHGNTAIGDCAGQMLLQ